MTGNKFANNKLITLAAVVVITAAIITVAVVFGSQDQTANLPYSPNIIDLTQPVKSIRGTVKSVDNNQVTVASLNNEKVIPFTVLIDKNTKIGVPTTTRTIFGFLSKEKIQETSINDIRVGTDVTINTESDIRLAKNNAFTASAIFIPASNREIGGTITDVKENELTMDAYPQDGIISANSQPIRQRYTIKFDDKTEYYERSFEEPGKSPKVNPYKIQVNDQIGALLTQDIKPNTTLTAQALLKILAPKPTPAVVR